MTVLHDSPPVLTGGRWVNVRGVMRWQPDPPPEPRLGLSAIQACICGAMVTEHCRTIGGHRVVKAHKGRWIARSCACGEPPAGKSSRCEECKAKRRLETFRDSGRRKRERRAA